MQVGTLEELKNAAKSAEPEIIIVDDGLARKVLLWNRLRGAANVAVIVILGLSIFVWANPLRIAELEQGMILLARRIALGVGIVLLFAEYLLPVVRLYKPGAQEGVGLKLVLRRAR